MKTHIILISFILIFTAGCRYYQYPVKQGNMTILTLNGTPFQRGFFHGKFMKEEIDTIVHRWEKIVEESFDTDFNTVIDSFFETYGCLIMEMKKNPTLHIAPGKPNETEFITFQINKP